MEKSQSALALVAPLGTPSTQGPSLGSGRLTGHSCTGAEPGRFPGLWLLGWEGSAPGSDFQRPGRVGVHGAPEDMPLATRSGSHLHSGLQSEALPWATTHPHPLHRGASRPGEGQPSSTTLQLRKLRLSRVTSRVRSPGVPRSSWQNWPGGGCAVHPQRPGRAVSQRGGLWTPDPAG